MNINTTAVVLCAGKGTRIELGDNTPKCIRPIGGKPMITYTIDTLKQLGVSEIIVVVNPEDTHTKEILGENVTYVSQPEPKGNAHAVLQDEKQVKNSCRDCAFNKHGILYRQKGNALFAGNGRDQCLGSHRKGGT